MTLIGNSWRKSNVTDLILTKLIILTNFNGSDKVRLQVHWVIDRKISMVSSRNLLTQYQPYFDVNSKNDLCRLFLNESYFDSLNILRILLFFIIHVACRVNKKFRNTTKSVNLFPDHKRWKYICMKYISITKYIHCFTVNKYT